MKISILFLILGLFSGMVGCSAQSENLSISGKILLSPALSSKMDPSDVLFVFAFPAEADSPVETRAAPVKAESRASSTISSPVAVLKISPALFPVSYKLSRDDVLFPDRSFKGSLSIVARVDKDGDAQSVTPGDMEGIYKKNPVPVGASHVDVVIDQVK
jgi:hypothetical protein